MGNITVDPKGVDKLLDILNVHKAHDSDGLNAIVLKECSNEMSSILALIFNESLKKVKNMMLLTLVRCLSHASAAKL